MKSTNLFARKIQFLSLVAASVAFGGALPLQAQAPAPLGGAGSRPVAALLCQYPDKPNTYGFTPAAVAGTWVGNTFKVIGGGGVVVENSLNGLVQDASFGTVNFQGSQAYGWFTLPNPLSSYTYPIASGNDCIAAAQASGVNLAPFTYVAVYMNDALPNQVIPGQIMGLSWTASWQGKSASPTPLTAMIFALRGLTSPPLVLHELGHVLSNGGAHTDSATDPLGGGSAFGDNPATTPATGTTLTSNYRFAATGPEWDASRRELMGFIPAASIAKATGGTQTFNLSRLTQPLPGLTTAIDVPLPGGAKYVVSARTNIGYDGYPIYSNYFYPFKTVKTEGVRIELFTSTNVDAHIQMSKPGGNTESTDAVWLTGQTFTDTANGITITVNSFNATANPTAQITVTSARANSLPPGSWQAQPGLLTQISAGSDGTVMGVSGNNQIWQWNGTGWNQLPGAAIMVAVVNATNAYIWDGNAMFVWNGTGWTQVNLPNGVTAINWISAASNGTLYAVDGTGNVNRLDATAGTWSVVGSNAGHVAAQSGSVFYMLQNGSGPLPIGTIQQVSGGTVTTLPGILLDIAVDSAGDLWGSVGSQVWHWNGSNWDLQPGTFSQIAVGNFNTVWAINVDQASRTGTIAQWR